MQVFGTHPNGRDVHHIQLSDGPLSVSLLTLGAALQDVRLAGVDHSLTLGFPTLAPYLGPFPHAGTLMGPVANRIKGACATIDGETAHFDKNFLSAHTLHGGSAATHTQVWQVADQTTSAATLTLALPHGDGGFPGNRTLTARFDVKGTALTLTLTAETDRATLFNLANHSYWNLGSHPTTLGHTLQVAADHYLPADETELLPFGEIAPVDGTRFDFRAGRAITAGAEGLLDLNLCLSPTRQSLRNVATLTGPTGITLEMATTEPGLCFEGERGIGFGGSPVGGGCGCRAEDMAVEDLEPRLSGRHLQCDPAGAGERCDVAK
ncbi:MAG: galactose mutarotase [Pseudomonadota bacterium]